MRRSLPALLVCLLLTGAPRVHAAPPAIEDVPPEAMVDESEWTTADWTLFVLFGDLGMLAVGGVGALAGGLVVLATGGGADAQAIGYLAGFTVGAPVGASAAVHRWGNTRGPDGSFTRTLAGAGVGTAVWFASWVFATTRDSDAWLVPAGAICLVAPSLGAATGFFNSREPPPPAFRVAPAPSGAAGADVGGQQALRTGFVLPLVSGSF